MINTEFCVLLNSLFMSFLVVEPSTEPIMANTGSITFNLTLGEFSIRRKLPPSSQMSIVTWLSSKKDNQKCSSEWNLCLDIGLSIIC